MDRSNITILVVDHDEVSLAFVANILIERQYKVQTAKNAHDALVTLRANEGLFDIIITEFHVSGMNGFDFQKHIQNQFQVPVIMMSKDNRQHIISKTLENGATHFIVKPVCAEDFDDIQKYVVEAKKHKLFIDNLFAISDEEESSEQPNTKKEDCKRKSIDESSGGEEKYLLVKKSSRLVWTNELHNLFLDAINTTTF
ncbi:two-component response regulator ARR2 [Trifolium repens]|nr:two-component response regulator ARR2 [Trifolium repens]